MQTIVDLPEPQLKALDALAKARNQTPSEFLAEVLSSLLKAENAHPDKTKPLIDGFHLWGEHVTDGLDYERRIAPSGTTVTFLFDTNIVIDFINGVPQAITIFTPETGRAIGIMSRIEDMAGATPTTEPAIRAVLSTRTVLPLGAEIAERAALLRQQTRLKLPDAIIRATAQHDARTLITRNTRDFATADFDIHMPYAL